VIEAVAPGDGVAGGTVVEIGLGCPAGFDEAVVGSAADEVATAIAVGETTAAGENVGVGGVAGAGTGVAVGGDGAGEQPTSAVVSARAPKATRRRCHDIGHVR
jgi:hypothetical protein